MVMVNNQGVTLVEMIIVVSVVVILVVAMGFQFSGWMGGYKVESQMKEMYVDLLNARARAMQRNRMHFFSLAATQYMVYEDTNPIPDGDGTLQTSSDTRTQQKTLDSSISWSDPSVTVINFTRSGLADLAGIKTLCSNSSSDADYNCIEVSASRINLGKLAAKISAGGSCDDSNCEAK